MDTAERTADTIETGTSSIDRLNHDREAHPFSVTVEEIRTSADCLSLADTFQKAQPHRHSCRRLGHRTRLNGRPEGFLQYAVGRIELISHSTHTTALDQARHKSDRRLTIQQQTTPD